MTLRDEALESIQPPDKAPDRKWDPGYELDGTTGTITTDAVPDGDDPDWAAIFDMWGLSPDSWTIVPGSLRVNAWEMHGPDGDLRIHRQFKATIIRRNPEAIKLVNKTIEQLAEWKPPKRKAVVHEGGPAWVVCPADWQIGGRGGVEGFKRRYDSALSDLVDRARELRRQGVTELVVAFLADMGEGGHGNYPSQLYEIDLDIADQTELVTAAETLFLRELAPFFAKTTVVGIPGNHTRNSKDTVTSPHDVGDMTSYRWTASLLTASGEAEKWGIRFVAPDKFEGANFARIEAGGTRLLFAHGHQKKGSADAMRGWWKDVAFSRWGDADAADHLVTGHRHHTRVEEVSTDRWFIVCPTLGGDSTWFHDGGGPTSRPGILHYITEGASLEQLDIAGSP